jgi:hypothetical protein
MARVIAICTAVLGLVLALTACGKSSEKPEPEGPKLGGAVTVSFGDCAGPTARFESGPKPLPFGIAEVEASMSRRASADAPKQADPPTETAEGEMYGGGGLGEAGFGSGSKDTGWGTIGTGRYGTIGHGSGTGSGYTTGESRGGMRGRRSPVPQVRIGNATVTGDLDKNIVRRYVRRKLPRIKYCYEKQLWVDESLAGTVVTSFTIEADGKVSGETASGVDATVSSCIAGVIGAIAFPKPKSGTVQARYPFTFSALNEGSDDQPAPAKPKTPEVVDHIPGADNPLRDHGDAIEACFRKQRAARFATVIVEMAVGNNGAISDAKTHGLDGVAATCIANVAEQATWAKADASVYRCPVALGPMPVADAPGVDIKADAITYTAEVGATPRKVAELRDVMADTSMEWKLRELFDIVLKREARHVGSLPKHITAITGPTILRPIESTPMKAVQRVIKTLTAADSGPILAVQTDAGWTVLKHQHGLLDEMLPIAPIPYGTGADWPTGDTGFGATTSDLMQEEEVRISILLTENEIWVGLSRVSEFTRVDRKGDEYDWSAVADLLAANKKLPFFDMRTDIEIAAEDEVTYYAVARVATLAYDAGFSNWAIIDPSSLSAKPPL